MGWGGRTRKWGWSAWRWLSQGGGSVVRRRSRSDLLVAGFFFSWFFGWLWCGLMSFDLDRLVFFGSLLGFDDLATDWVGDDLAWLGFGLGGWWMGLGLNELRIEWVGFPWWCWLGVVMMVAGCGVIVGSDRLWVCEIGKILR